MKYIMLILIGIFLFIAIEVSRDNTIHRGPEKQNLNDKKIIDLADSLIEHEMFFEEDPKRTQEIRDSLLHQLNEKYMAP